MHWTLKGEEGSLPRTIHGAVWLASWQGAYDCWLAELDGHPRDCRALHFDASARIHPSALESEAVRRIEQELRQEAVYRELQSAQKVSSMEIRESAAYALSLWLCTLRAESGDREALQIMEGLPTLVEELHRICHQEAQGLCLRLLDDLDREGKKSSTERLERLVRITQVRVQPDSGKLRFEKLLASEEGHELLSSVLKTLSASPLLHYLLLDQDIVGDERERVCEHYLSQAFERVFFDQVKGMSAEVLLKRIPAINSLDAQVRNLIQGFEEIMQYRWQTLQTAERKLMDTESPSEACAPIRSRIYLLEQDLQGFEDVLGRIGMRRLDVLDQINRLQEVCSKIRTSALAEESMIALIEAHPHWNSETHVQALLGQSKTLILSLCSYCQLYSPAREKPIALARLEEALATCKQRLRQEDTATLDLLESAYVELRRHIMLHLDHYAALHRKEISESTQLIETLLETLRAFQGSLTTPTS
jgi:hypothetical protein